MSFTISPDDIILLLSPDDKTFLVKVQEEKKFSSHLGMLDLSQAIGKSWGDRIKTNLDNEFILLEPTVEDKLMKVRRLTQIVYPKDAAFIVFKTGIRSGMKIIETGVGSGALTIALANAVAPDGRVYSYERREEFIKNASDNLKHAGLLEFVEFINQDARDGFEIENADVAIIDLPSPWHGIPSAYDALRGGGRIASISPTYNQVEVTVQCLEETGFVHIETLELILRNYQVKQGKTRPRDRMVGHTGFLTFARKAFK